MRFLSFLSLTFIFCFCIGIGLSNAQTVKDNLLVKQYKERYEANNFKLDQIVNLIRLDCIKKCSDEDKEAIKKLAENGEMFALAIQPWISGVDTKSLQYSADKGEPASSTLYSSAYPSRMSYQMSINYATSAVKKGNARGYSVLLEIHKRHGEIGKFCSTAKQGYEKFGIEFLAPYFIYDKSEASVLFFSNCTKQKPAELLARKGNEGMLIQGYIYVNKGKYKEAYDIFEKLYKPGDSSKISANAGYCLGMMNYYGNGIKQSKTKGRQLLKESFNNGIVYDSTPEQVSLPDRLELLTYRGSSCNHKLNK